MPSASSTWAAWMPSQVAAILISTLAPHALGFARGPSGDGPGPGWPGCQTQAGIHLGGDTARHMPEDLRPKRTRTWSTTSSNGAPRWACTTSVNRGAYSAFWTAFRMREGLVVASRRELRQLQEVTGVRHDDRVALELFEGMAHVCNPSGSAGALPVIWPAGTQASPLMKKSPQRGGLVLRVHTVPRDDDRRHQPGG